MKTHSKAKWLIENCGDAEANCKRVGRWLQKEVKCARVGNRRAGWLERIQQTNKPITEDIFFKKRKEKELASLQNGCGVVNIRVLLFGFVVIIEEFLTVAIFHLQIHVYNRIHLILWASTCKLTRFQSQVKRLGSITDPCCPAWGTISAFL